MVDRRTDTDTWWRADLTCHNPVTSYRFILEGGPASYAWLNGTGLHLRDVPDAADFRLVTYDAPPAWALDAVVYQIFPDRFAEGAWTVTAPDWAVPARTGTSPVTTDRGRIGQQLYGGDLDGITAHLDHIVSLGATVVYLTPFFPSRSNHRYDASSFDAVDPVLGGDEALARLVERLSRRAGCGSWATSRPTTPAPAHEWFRRAQADPGSEEHGFYLYEDGDYVSWLGVPSLPKLNYDSGELRRRVFDDPDGVVRKWLGGAAGLDGWRVDVANMTGRYKEPGPQPRGGPADARRDGRRPARRAARR